jgi:tRNA(adenine34) deaminase
MISDFQWMSLALEQANCGARVSEVPIGAVLVKEGRVIAAAHNQTESEGSFIAHAEMIVLREACSQLETKYLEGCELYVTVEPCRMCLAAAQLSRISKIVYGVSSEKFGADGSAYHPIAIEKLSDESLSSQIQALLSDFFRSRRS